MGVLETIINRLVPYDKTNGIVAPRHFRSDKKTRRQKTNVATKRQDKTIVATSTGQIFKETKTNNKLSLEWTETSERATNVTVTSETLTDSDKRQIKAKGLSEEKAATIKAVWALKIGGRDKVAAKLQSQGLKGYSTSTVGKYLAVFNNPLSATSR